MKELPLQSYNVTPSIVDSRHSEINNLQSKEHTHNKLCLEWTKRHRLPFFRKSHLFREYKLFRKLVHNIDSSICPSEYSFSGEFTKTSSPTKVSFYLPGNMKNISSDKGFYCSTIQNSKFSLPLISTGLKRSQSFPTYERYDDYFEDEGLDDFMSEESGRRSVLEFNDDNLEELDDKMSNGTSSEDLKETFMSDVCVFLLLPIL